jgi:formylglycine-generating enzyme required for sulfatase activity
MDLSGNVWEWQANFRDKDHDVLAMRGGSVYDIYWFARVAYRSYSSRPDLRVNVNGFRLAVFALPH